MSDVIFVPRSTWYDRAPHNNDGTTTRAKLPTPVAGGLVIHYTGSPWIPKASTDTAQAYMRWMQDAAFRQRKSFEYNDIVPPRADGSAQVWEYAGDYMAAHAGSTNNMRWYAIQVAIGVNNHPSYANYDRTKPVQWQPLQDGMVEAIRWRRHDLVERGILAEVHEVREHRNLPNVATTCPGDAVRSRWPDLLVPWSKDPPPPIEEEENMDKSRLWRPKGYQNIFIITPAGNVLHASAALLAAFGIPATNIIEDDHQQALLSMLHLAGLTVSDLVKA